MKRKIFRLAMSLLFIALLPTSVLAFTAPPLDIDFRDAAWSAANYQHSFSAGGVTATAYKNKNDVAKLYQDSTDGLGIRGGEEDEINSKEKLVVNFASPTFVTELWISDLFGPPKESPIEKGYVKLYNGSSSLGKIHFSGIAGPGSDPQLKINIGQTLTKAKFRSNGKKSEFSVVGFNTGTSVSDSGNTLILLGIGLASFAAFRRFRATR